MANQLSLMQSTPHKGTHPTCSRLPWRSALAARLVPPLDGAAHRPAPGLLLGCAPASCRAAAWLGRGCRAALGRTRHAIADGAAGWGAGGCTEVLLYEGAARSEPSRPSGCSGQRRSRCLPRPALAGGSMGAVSAAGLACAVGPTPESDAAPGRRNARHSHHSHGVLPSRCVQLPPRLICVLQHKVPCRPPVKATTAGCDHMRTPGGAKSGGGIASVKAVLDRWQALSAVKKSRQRL